jgi:TfoX/Sxy family transcriptional regulator of competence genes
MAFDETIADQIRLLLDGAPNLRERRMFGGIAWMIQGNMACGIARDFLMVRVGADAYDAALDREEAREISFTGRPMRGMVEIDLAALIDDDELLADWVGQGMAFALSLPPK